MTSPWQEYPEANPYTSAPMTGSGDTIDSGLSRHTTRILNIKTNNKPGTSLSPWFMNGPSAAAFNAAQTQENLVMAQVENLSRAQAKPLLERWSRLLTTYGHTNSPGVLWALAQSGLDPDTDAVQSLLQTDAKATEGEYNSRAPSVAQSPSSEADESNWFDNVWPDNFWAVPQAAARNAFSALSMPLEALQGVERNIGRYATGAYAAATGDETAGTVGDNIKGLIGTVASIAPPLAAVVDGTLLPDDQFQNPWEQTTFGQQLLAVGGGAGLDAFGSMTAGLDQAKAQELLETDPKYVAQRAQAISNPDQLPTILEDIAEENGLYSSPGWFVDETSQIGEAQRQSTYHAWAIPGPDDTLTAWTLGRGIASNIGGPDWAGYGVLSGLVDFANALVDPTIFGAKFGVVSKSARGIGVLAEKAGVTGAERALTFGKEGRKVRNALGVTNFNSDKIIREYNSLAGKSWNEANKITPEEWANMGVEDQAAIVQQMKKMQAVEEARRGLAPKVDAIRSQMRGLRRAISGAARTGRVTSNQIEDADDLARQQRVWNGAVDASYIKDRTPPAAAAAPEAPPAAAAPTQAPPERTWIKDGTLSPTSELYGETSIYKDGNVWRAVRKGEVSDATYRTKAAARTAAEELQNAADRGVYVTPQRTLSVRPAGDSWVVIDDATGESNITSTTKRGAQEARRRQIKKEASEAETEAALNAKPLTPEAPAAAPSGVRFSPRKLAMYLRSLSPEDRAAWDRAQEHLATLVESGKIKAGDAIELGSVEDLAQNVRIGKMLRDRAAKAAEKAPKGKHAKTANADATRLVLLNESHYAADSLKDVDFAGATLMAVPDGPGWYGRGINDMEDVLVYWNGKALPNTVEALDVVPQKVIDEVRDRVMAVLDEEAGAHPGYAKNGNVLHDSLGESLAEMRDSRTYLDEVLSSPDLEWRHLLYTLGGLGLDGYLDDIMRANGVDGIKGVVGKNSEGIWLGDHPDLEMYRFPSDAVTRAETIGGTADEKEALLAAIPNTAVRTGLHAASPSRLATLTAEHANEAALNRAWIDHVDSNALSQAEIAQQRLDSILEDIDVRFADRETALKETLGHEAGMVAGNGRSVTADPKGVRWFLFGSSPLAHFRQKTMTALHSFLTDAEKARLRSLDPAGKEFAEEYGKLAALWTGRLSQVTNNKWTPETYKALFDNALNDGGEEGVLQILANRLGLDVNKGDLSRGLRVMDKDGAKEFRTWRTSSGPVRRNIARMMGERPNSRKVNLENSDDVIDAIVKYGMYAKIAPDKINRYVGEVILGDQGFAGIETNVDVFKRLFNDIGDSLMGNLTKDKQFSIVFAGESGQRKLQEMQNAMYEATRLFLGGKQGATSPRIARYGTPSTQIRKVINEEGEEVSIPDISIDSELLTGHIALPSVDDWGMAMNRVAASIHRFDAVGAVFDMARSAYDTLFRTSLLVFRGSYVIRNSAEMQIRMFLNGHQSVLTDPLTLIGMVTPGFSKAARARYADRYAPFSQTVLDTAFEVGLDEQAAVANHVEDFFAITRQSHSLTDPRVYAYGVRNGWTPIGFDSPHFYKGWSNELIMLHRSEIARMVSGEMPPWARSLATGHPSQTLPDAVVDALLSDVEEAARLRARLIASNSDYAKILSSRKMTREWLFGDGSGAGYSVYDRIAKFTMDDPQLLEFIRTGRFGNTSIKSIPKLEDRIKHLSGSLQMKYSKVDQKAMAEHFDGINVGVPWNETLKQNKKAQAAFDWFFEVTNKIERLGSVGPEFRMAYWDRIAELAPALRRQDVKRALKAAETTLGPLKRMNPDGKLVDIGRNHPAWEALKKAERENTDGMMKLDELHDIANQHAAKHVRELFYDAAQRNNFWAAMRFIVPFGQAWGNTWKMWAELGAANPVQVYKVQKAFNAALQSGSTALYELGENLGAYGDYAPGFAPWDQDASGGLLYTNQYGDSTFMSPFVGRAAAIPVGALAGLGLGGIEEVPMQSSAESMNVAGGILPGVSFLGALGMNLLPDSDIIDGLERAARPFGQDAQPGLIESAIPPWLAKIIGAVSGVNGKAEEMIGGLAPQNKNRFVRDAAVLLSASQGYNLTDPIDAQRWKEDTRALAGVLLLTTGLLQNFMPTTNSPAPAVDLTADDVAGLREKPNKGMYGLFMTNALYPLYLERAAGDATLARQLFVSDYGMPFLFALTGTSKNTSPIPSSDALKWARAHPREADVYLDDFTKFFPEGDSSDVIAMRWMNEHSWADAERKNPDEVISENISAFIQAQTKHVEFEEATGILSADEADAKKQAIKEAFVGTQAGTYYGGMTRTQQIDKAQYAMEHVPSLAQTQAGQAFAIALHERDLALQTVRTRSGDPNRGLGGEQALGVKQMYVERINGLIAQYPDFRVLGNTMLREWE